MVKMLVRSLEKMEKTTELKEEDVKILSHLRNNARTSLVDISKETHIPQSTVYQRLEQYERKYIKKHTCLLDFERLGFKVKTMMVLKIRKEDRLNFLEFIAQHPHINNAHKTNDGFDFILECVFVDHDHCKIFLEELEEHFGIEQKCVYPLLQNLKQEAFLAGTSKITLPRSC